MKKMAFYVTVTGLLGLLISCASAPVGSVRFPEPTLGFTPKKVYNVRPVNLANVIETVFEENRILLSSKQPLKMVTEYIQGQTENQIGGLGGTITTRYRYTIQLKKLSGKKTKLIIYCGLEASGGAAQAPWHDIGADNPQVITALENWLYEQIEGKLR